MCSTVTFTAHCWSLLYAQNAHRIIGRRNTDIIMCTNCIKDITFAESIFDIIIAGFDDLEDEGKDLDKRGLEMEERIRRSKYDCNPIYNCCFFHIPFFCIANFLFAFMKIYNFFNICLYIP